MLKYKSIKLIIYCWINKTICIFCELRSRRRLFQYFSLKKFFVIDYIFLQLDGFSIKYVTDNKLCA